MREGLRVRERNRQRLGIHRVSRANLEKNYHWKRKESKKKKKEKRKQTKKVIRLNTCRHQ